MIDSVRRERGLEDIMINENLLGMKGMCGCVWKEMDLFCIGTGESGDGVEAGVASRSESPSAVDCSVKARVCC